MLKATFKIVSGNSIWGGIGGNIENQKDLVDFVDTEISALGGDIETQIATLDSKIDSVQSVLEDEISAFETDLNGKIDEEQSARIEADNTLQDNIDTLDNKIDTHIADKTNPHEVTKTQVGLGNVDNTSDLNKPISTATQTALNDISNTVSNNYNALNEKIGTNTSNLNSLSTTVTNNYNTLDGRITSEVSTLNTAIGTEATNRQNEDNNLQSQIDAIVSSSDVFDIVGTYAELQAYEISTVPVNDIIKVLVDSTHNNAATYYRCIETAGVKSWSYIGTEGAYYTKSESDSLFVKKTTTINDKPLSNNITLTAADVGALPSSTTIGNGILTIQNNGVDVDTFNANSTTNKIINLVTPTKISDLADDTATNPIDKAETLTGLTATITELNYVDGVTSSIQTQLNGKQTTANLVTSVSSSSTDSQYPSAKLFYDTCGDIETLINAL